MSNSTPQSEGSFRRDLFFGPFRFDSDLDLPELRHATGPGSIPVSLRQKQVPRAIEDGVFFGPECQFTATEYLLEIPGTAGYYVANGRQVDVEIVPGTPINNVSTYLLGSVFGALCHQNRLLPLHASAVAGNSSVVAFLGDSGAGKSTVAACLARRGHTVVSDDICLLQSVRDSMQVIPVAGWLKLWQQTLDHLGEDPVEQHRVFSTDDKYRLYLQSPAEPADPTALRLTRVVLLDKCASPDAPPRLEPLDVPAAVAALMEMVYLSYYPANSGQQARVFQQCARILQQAQALRLSVPWGLDRIDSVLDVIEHEVLAPLSGRQ